MFSFEFKYISLCALNEVIFFFTSLEENDDQIN